MGCYFCQRNIKEVDFKDRETLRKFISGLGKIRSRKRTKTCLKHQRKLAKAIKKARYLGLFSY